MGQVILVVEIGLGAGLSMMTTHVEVAAFRRSGGGVPDPGTDQIVCQRLEQCLR